MRWPHGFGYRVDMRPGELRLVGRNVAVPFLVMLFAFVALLPAIVVFHDAGRVAGEPVAMLALLALLVLGAGGAVYSARCIPVQREMVFSRDGITLSDICVTRRRERRLVHSAVRRIDFTVSWPHRSLFKIARIALVQAGGAAVDAVHADAPMYAWQGRTAYQALKVFLAENGRSHLLGPEPDFSLLGLPSPR
jgi:hypothetical protein